jgi:hypothetical protein
MRFRWTVAMASKESPRSNTSRAVRLRPLTKVKHKPSLPVYAEEAFDEFLGDIQKSIPRIVNAE